MQTTPNIRTTPFESVYGYRPQYEMKQEAFNYLKFLLSSPEFLNDTYTVIAHGLPMNHEMSQRFNERYSNYQEHLGAMNNELMFRFGNIDGETAYFILGLQVNQELQALSKMLTAEHVQKIIIDYYKSQAITFALTDNSPVGKPFTPMKHLNEIKKGDLTKLIELLSGLISKYKSLLDNVAGGRFTQQDYVSSYGNVAFTISERIPKRIELSEHNLEVVKRYFLLLTLDRNMSDIGKPMMEERDALKLVSYHFCDGPMPEYNRYDCTLFSTHLRYFVYYLYLKLKNKENAELSAFRKIVLSFSNCQKTGQDDTIQNTFTKKPAGFKKGLQDEMDMVLEKLI